MNREFIDKSGFIFGRDADIAFLLARTRMRGVTAVLARAQMGKSWLLTEVARRLLSEGWPETSVDSPLSLRGLPPLVGVVESQGESADMLPRAVQDLYTRWLANARYSDQALVAVEQQKKDFVGRVGEAVGSLVAKAAGLQGKGMEVVGGLVKQTFDGLATANRTLVSGGMELPRLQITDSHDLLEIVWKVTKQPAVLILDQWEKSPDLAKEANILDSYLRNHKDWPACHILLGTRPDERPRELVSTLAEEWPGVCEIYELGPMDLSNPASTATMLASLRERVPATRGVTDDDLLAMIAGYPRVLSQWTSPFRAQSMRSREDLARVAEDANNFRYAEFEKLMPELSESERLLAIRLALLPTTSSADDWRALRALVLDGCPAKNLDSLMRADVLEAASPPTYGHAKRAEAAFLWLLKNCPYELRETADGLVTRLSKEISDLSPSAGPYISSLTQLRGNASRLELASLPLALCESAYSVLLKPDLEPNRLTGAAGLVGDTGVFPLLAMGLNNAMAYAKQDQALKIRDDLLCDLRSLAVAHMENGTVRKYLAFGLYNTLIDAKEENDLTRRDHLIEELRVLASNYPEDTVLREELAKGLFNTFTQAEEEKETLLRDRILQELRLLSDSHPREPALTAELARVLSNMMVYAKRAETLELRDSLLEELRELTAAHPENSELCGQLALSLFNAMNHAHQEGKPRLRDKLIQELWELQLKNPEDRLVREYLAKALSNRMAYADKEENIEVRRSLLRELRALTAAYPDDGMVREKLARSLNSMLLYAKETENPDLRDTLVDELRKLVADHPDEKAMVQMLAVGLINILPGQSTEDLGLRDRLLENLSEIIAKDPDDPYMQTVIVPRLQN